MFNFSERLDTYIKKSGLSVEDFAKKVGASRAMVYKYLKNENDPPLTFLQNIKKEFPWADLEWLTMGEPSIVSDSGEAYRDMTTELINRHLEHMCDEQRRDVLKYVEKTELYERMSGGKKAR